MTTVVSADWTDLLLGRLQDPANLLAGARLVVGAAHRLAWLGPDDLGDRKRAVRWLRDAVGALDASQPGLAAVLDWWLVVALQEDPIKRAWSVDREVGAPAGDALRRILEGGGGFKEVRRPVRLKEVLDELRTASDRNPGKIAGDKPILQAANDECKRVLRAAKDVQPPPGNLRMLVIDRAEIEAWASEGPVSRRVDPGTPVWDHLVKQLTLRAELIQEAVKLWPRLDRKASVALPSGWEDSVRDACGDGADIAIALVQDALAEPPRRPILEQQVVRAVLAGAPSGAVRPAAFRLAREAWASDPGDRAEWATRIATSVAELQSAMDARDYAGEAGEALREARAQLAEIDLDGAASWLKAADDEHRGATRDADLDRRRARAKDHAAHLAALGLPVPAEVADLEVWGAAVDMAWTEARSAIRRDLDALTADLPVFGRYDAARLEASLEDARAALERSQLPAASQAIRVCRGALQELRLRDEQRLGADLARLRDRALRWGVRDRSGFLAAVDRVVARRGAGLDADALVRDLGGLADALERRAFPAAVCTVDTSGRLTRAAWVPGGVEAAGEDARQVATKVRNVAVMGADAGVVAAWGEVLPPTADTSGTHPVYHRERGEIVGPYVVREGRRAPLQGGAVGVVGEARFAELFGLIDVGGQRALVPHPPSLDDLVAVGGTVRDALDERDVADWIAGAVEGAPPAAAIAAWIATQSSADLPPAVAEARLRRMSRLVGTAEALEGVRESAIQGFLASGAGVERIERAVERAVERDSARLRAAVADARARLAEEEDAGNARLAELRSDLAAAEELLGDRKLRLLAELGGGRVQAATTSTAPAIAAPIRSTPFHATDAPDLPTLIREVAGPTWQITEVANLILSLATGRWTLLAGLPGVGKSTFARSVLSRLGHGPGTERYLELVVRRDWQDDAALFGFWHPTERTWMPSSEGFVEQLLRAHDDDRQGRGGIWPILVEELNLASPEYYLARPISAFESASPEVRLYDAALEPGNGARYPASFKVPDSVRILGTVNVDDTVERLSPRFLSRASVIWIEPQMDVAPWRPEDDAPVHHVRWSALSGLADREADIGRIGDVVRFLQDERIPGAPTVRTRAAIGRYLAASRGILAAPEAEDLQILQRVLPPIRGTGARWRGLLDRLAELLARNGWSRSAARTRELRERGEELGDWYDFFHS